MSKFFEKLTGKTNASKQEDTSGLVEEEETYTFSLSLVTNKGEEDTEGTFAGGNFLEVKRISSKGSEDTEWLPITKDLAEYLYEGSRLERMELHFKNRFTKGLYGLDSPSSGHYSLLLFEFITGVKFSYNFIRLHSEKFSLRVRENFMEESLRVHLSKSSSLSISADPQDTFFNQEIEHDFLEELPSFISNVAKSMREDLRRSVGNRMNSKLKDSFYPCMLLAYLMYLSFLENEKKNLDLKLKIKLNEPAYRPVLTELREIKREAEDLYRDNLNASKAARDFALMKIGELFRENEPDYFGGEEGKMQGKIKEDLLRDIENLRESLLETFIPQTKGEGEERVYQ